MCSATALLPFTKISNIYIKVWYVFFCGCAARKIRLISICVQNVWLCYNVSQVYSESNIVKTWLVEQNKRERERSGGRVGKRDMQIIRAGVENASKSAMCYDLTNEYWFGISQRITSSPSYQTEVWCAIIGSAMYCNKQWYPHTSSRTHTLTRMQTWALLFSIA